MKNNFKYQNFFTLQKNTNLSSKLSKLLKHINDNGFVIRENIFTKKDTDELRIQLDKVWEDQLNEFGSSFLKKINEFGIARCFIDKHYIFQKIITKKQILEVVDLTVGPNAILHLQNGIINYPEKKHNQATFHRDFAKDFISSKMLSINALIAIDDFKKNNGSTIIVPKTHKDENFPSKKYIHENAIQITAPAGSVIFFDSLLFHKVGSNLSENKRRAINLQYTRPFIKQQIDYPKLYADLVPKNSLLAQKLGFWAISPKSLNEFRVANPNERTYKVGQG